MVRIAWGIPGSKKYETGLDRGVLYPFESGSIVGDGVPWNGLISVTENVSGGDVESFHYDGVKYLDVILYEDFQATLEAFGSPPEFAPCDGNFQVALGMYATQQPRVPFHLSYRTGVGDDLSEESTTKLHCLYNLMAGPAEKVRRTRSNEAELQPTSWTIYGRPPRPSTYGGATYKPTAHLIFDLGVIGEVWNINTIEDRIYGSAFVDAQMPTQEEWVTFLTTGSWT